MTRDRIQIGWAAATGGAILVGWGVYLAFQWHALRVLIIVALRALAIAFGLPMRVEGFNVSLGGIPTFIGRDCTYLTWWVTAIPLLWTAPSRKANVRRAMLAIAISWCVNLLRIFIALWATADGVPWFWAHDLPDYLLWYGSIGVLTFLWTQKWFDASCSRQMAESPQ